jgi:hypothetical protein
MSTLIAWFTLGSSTATVTDSDGEQLATIALTVPLVDDEWNPERGLDFINDALTAHFGIGRWLNAGQPLRDDEAGTVGIDFDLNL